MSSSFFWPLCSSSLLINAIWLTDERKLNNLFSRSLQRLLEAYPVSVMNITIFTKLNEQTLICTIKKPICEPISLVLCHEPYIVKRIFSGQKARVYYLQEHFFQISLPSSLADGCPVFISWKEHWCNLEYNDQSRCFSPRPVHSVHSCSFWYVCPFLWTLWWNFLTSLENGIGLGNLVFCFEVREFLEIIFSCLKPNFG